MCLLQLTLAATICRPLLGRCAFERTSLGSRTRTGSCALTLKRQSAARVRQELARGLGLSRAQALQRAVARPREVASTKRCAPSSELIGGEVAPCTGQQSFAVAIAIQISEHSHGVRRVLVNRRASIGVRALTLFFLLPTLLFVDDELPQLVVTPDMGLLFAGGSQMTPSARQVTCA